MVWYAVPVVGLFVGVVFAGEWDGVQPYGIAMQVVGCVVVVFSLVFCRIKDMQLTRVKNMALDASHASLTDGLSPIVGSSARLNEQLLRSDEKEDFRGMHIDAASAPTKDVWLSNSRR